MRGIDDFRFQISGFRLRLAVCYNLAELVSNILSIFGEIGLYEYISN